MAIFLLAGGATVAALGQGPPPPPPPQGQARDSQAQGQRPAGTGTAVIAANTPVEGYAPVFFPGTTEIGVAQVLRVDVSQEHSGIDFGLTRVPLTSVTGTVIAPPGVNASSAQIRLLQPATA